MLSCVSIRLALLLSFQSLIFFSPLVKFSFYTLQLVFHSVNFRADSEGYVHTLVCYSLQLRKIFQLWWLGRYFEWGSYSKWCDVYLGLHIMETPLVDEFPFWTITSHSEFGFLDNISSTSPQLASPLSSPFCHLILDGE